MIGVDGVQKQKLSPVWKGSGPIETQSSHYDTNNNWAFLKKKKEEEEEHRHEKSFLLETKAFN